MTPARSHAGPFRLALLALGSAGLLFAADAEASGLYFTDRGVRPMGRGGAFVAGADDLGAIWYNPAGLADAGTSVLADFGWLHFTDSYARQLQIVDAQGTVRIVPSPTVNGGSPVLPIPTIAWSLALDKKRTWTIAGGMLAPEVALASYPDTVNGQPSPSRYSLGSYSGSLLAELGGWVAWKPIEQLRFGAGVLALVGYFQTSVTFSACPADRLVCAPEQSEWDAKSQVRVGPIVAPTVNGGVTWVPSKYIRFGMSGQAPMVVSSHATIQVQLPNDVAFDTAHINGSDAHVSFTLPAIFRMGVEVRPIEKLRIEAAFVREFWTTQHSIDAVPEGISITGVTGLPASIAFPSISFPRNFDNANSYRLGGEYTFDAWGYPLDARMGVSYDQSAVPTPYVSLLSLDMNKVIVSLGGGIHVGKHWRFDAVYAHVFAETVFVPPDQAAIPRINPLNGNAPLETVNGGTYTAEADLIGVGLNYLF
jgi:long-chain fatty acid transport protein